jgi:hypothetical protein
MKLAKASANLLAALAMSFCLVPGAWAQGKPAKKEAGKPQAAKATKTTKTAKASAPAPAKPPTAPAPAAAAPGGKKIEAEGKRDPFVPLLSTVKEAGMHLPPGKAGLVIATVHVDGAVRSPGGMLAVVSNPEQRVYFIREGDRLYDGDVEKIGMDGVTFRENTKDAFGKPVERVVTKRIYASAGEQQ